MIKACFKVAYRSSVKSDFSLDVKIDIPSKGVTAIFGHSGSGKTTLLRCIAGLEDSVHGHLEVSGQVWQNDNYCLKTYKRPIGYVFQEASLFDHLSAHENLLFAMKRAEHTVSQDNFDRIISVLGIKSQLTRYPNELSGGERQRVAIARALLVQPKILLMDEPLASLDTARKREILPYLERLHENFDIPILYVSHSLDEVARLADHVVVLEAGKVKAQGELTQVFSTLEYSSYFEQGTGVIIKAAVLEKDRQWHLMKVGFTGGELWLSDNDEKISEEVRVRILAKDVSLALSNHEDSSIANRLAGKVEDIIQEENSPIALVRLKVGDEFIIARLTGKSLANLGLKEGMRCWAQIKSVAIVH
ncbi:molybdenum ABC transporter ATP-binding protein [Litorilituus lipolyticus]|uniref:Molybdenum ABC transporter ATP-binding protein n=1 Tax=Litorilituus lipolyticus TaxID=2491017 RepID=A0A502L3E6_9GAMM|nr:molybdenum ABC transporter ATP-binding protein [Litorilituus lipolyticus]TPH18480.1 molybdenum ABC transporter ATP-binding protein [Litorilituus lipolyticus]